MNNKNRLFYGSCFALITTAFSFSIRAGILPQLGEAFDLSGQQLGFINSMWFLGFPISMILGGLFYHTIGPKRIMQFAFLTHMLGIILTIYSGGYVGLLISTLLIGIGNGCTEAACNPMIADAYEGKEMNTLLNRFHMWFPGGIVLGSLISKFMTDADLGWQAQIWVIVIPTLIYVYLFYGQEFPKSKVEAANSVTGNLKAMATPILALVTGLMAVGRYFGGDIVHKFDQTGVLLGSAVLAAIGIFLFSTQTGPMVYVAAIFFALGVCYFWPNMIGFVAEKIPASGALGMSIVGGMGMFSTSIFQPIIGGWIDNSTVEQAANGLTGTELDLAAGQQTLTYMISFPGVLIVLFTILYFWQRNLKPVAG